MSSNVANPYTSAAPASTVVPRDVHVLTSPTPRRPRPVTPIPGRPGPGGGPARDADPTGRHVFFTGGPANQTQPGRLHLECARCHTVTPVSPIQLLRARAPLFVWVPVMKYSRWARCPACSKHSWVKLHVRL